MSWKSFSEGHPMLQTVNNNASHLSPAVRAALELSAEERIQRVRSPRWIGYPMAKRMLIIDEIHHVLAGSLLQQHNFLNTIKHLSNELQIPIVGVGTREAFNALQTDPQLANRFEPVFLPRWTIGSGLKPRADPYLQL